MVVLQQSPESFGRGNEVGSSVFFPCTRQQSFLAFSPNVGVPLGEKYEGGSRQVGEERWGHGQHKSN